MRRRVVLNWEVANYTGWGVYGLQLALAWAGDPQLEPMTSVPMEPELLHLDPARRQALEPFLAASRRLQDSLKTWAGGSARTPFPMLAGATGRFTIARAANDVGLTGDPTIAVAFFESPTLAPDVIERARRFPLIVTGSTWNEQVLRAHGVAQVRTVLQGVDPLVFHPGPRSDANKGRFVVFSGGKLERRKGQDIVLAAFRIFAQRHPDAVLATAWHSPFPDAARSLDESGLAPPVVFADSGFADVGAWAASAGLAAHQVLDLGVVANQKMAPLLREMDVGLFPNRAEGGTNLVAMECMACGVPAILSRNTGHLDLLADESAYVLDAQAPVPGREGFGAAAGWGESSVDEAVALLERVYRNRDEARRRGLAGAQTLAGLSWSRTAQAMKEIVLSFA